MRRSLVVTVLAVLVAAAACGGDDGASGTTATTGTDATSAPPATAPGTSAPTPSSEPSSATSSTTSEPGAASPTLPPDDRPRTPPVDATAELAGVAAAPSFEALADEVVRAVEAGFPPGEGNQSTTSASAASGANGTVQVRVDGLADDSLAGWEYTVEAVESGAGWEVTEATKVAICRRGLSGDLCL